jgi:hypothetical protein
MANWHVLAPRIDVSLRTLMTALAVFVTTPSIAVRPAAGQIASTTGHQALEVGHAHEVFEALRHNLDYDSLSTEEARRVQAFYTARGSTC